MRPPTGNVSNILVDHVRDNEMGDIGLVENILFVGP